MTLNKKKNSFHKFYHNLLLSLFIYFQLKLKQCKKIYIITILRKLKEVIIILKIITRMNLFKIMIKLIFFKLKSKLVKKADLHIITIEFGASILLKCGIIFVHWKNKNYNFLLTTLEGFQSTRAHSTCTSLHLKSLSGLNFRLAKAALRCDLKETIA